MSTDANMQPQYPKPSLASQTQSSLALAPYRISSENKKRFHVKIKRFQMRIKDYFKWELKTISNEN